MEYSPWIQAGAGFPWIATTGKREVIMPRIAWQIILRVLNGGNRRSNRGRPAMKLVKDTERTINEKSATRDELKLVCQRIADIDALWRTSAFGQAPAEKRAA